ncbi:calcium-binding protein [Novosphingobium sp. G106]|uniref:calcium-binding protein n=1 Tax=Novosphingobium sp. G106 TaxID=2849500 RepID=UPI001C2CF251|nr:calcium-binding protein [Novosphingobium sp. G106]MBV1691748.1 calcium-binding protein [Novosphingobium sp. G106]
MVFSPDGSKLYVSSGGTVTAYSVASGAVTATWAVGTQLGGMDVSTDGHYLVATELTYGPTVSSTDNPWGTARDVSVYRLDLTTGVTTTFTTKAEGYDANFFDASFTSTGKVLLTQNFLGSGWMPLTTLDFTTGTFTRDTSSFAQDGTLTATANKSEILHLPSNISDAPLFIHDASGAVIASHQGYADNVSGYNGGVQAISSSGNLIVQGVGLNVYDGSLHYIRSLQRFYPEFTNVTGLAFSPDDSKLYLLDANAREVFVLNTADWSVAGGYSVGSEVNQAGQSFGDSLRVSSNGRYLSVTGPTNVQIIDLSLAVSDAGTSANDTLTGDSANNNIYGFDGNDTINGGAGNDVMTGGRGNDSYVVDSLGDQVVERAGEGTDTVTTSVDSYSLPSEVENLTLTGSAITGYGNAGDNLLTGNSTANQLFGYGGNDKMIGGNGDDTYYVESSGDVVVELPGEGNDLVVTTVSYTLAANVERLTLAAGSASLAGTGNVLANVIIGNAGG